MLRISRSGWCKWCKRLLPYIPERDLVIVDICEDTVAKNTRHREVIVDTFEHRAFVKVAIREPGFLDDHEFTLLQFENLIVVEFPGLDEWI